jgi:hypothetical protein
MRDVMKIEVMKRAVIMRPEWGEEEGAARF